MTVEQTLRILELLLMPLVATFLSYGVWLLKGIRTRLDLIPVMAQRQVDHEKADEQRFETLDRDVRELRRAPGRVTP